MVRNLKNTQYLYVHMKVRSFAYDICVLAYLGCKAHWRHSFTGFHNFWLVNVPVNINHDFTAVIELNLHMDTLAQMGARLLLAYVYSWTW